jgi:hypothetical protein
MSRKSKKWTEKQLEELFELYRAGTPVLHLAKRFCRSIKAIQRQLERNGVTREKKTEATFEEDLSNADQLYWKQRYKALSRKYDKLLENRTIVDVLAESILDIAPKSYEPAAQQYKLHPKSTGEEQHAVAHLSDSHIGQVVHANQTSHFGNYGFNKFLDRATYFQKSIISICTEHVNTPLPVLHICLGGDLLHGDLAHANEAAHVMPLFTQYYAGGHVLAQVIRNLAAYFERVEVHGVVGNHTRWGTQRKMPTVNRFSNLDMFVMSLMEALTRDVPNVKWDLSPEIFDEFEVLGYMHRLEHGDHLRGGDRALGVPSHAFGRELSATSQLYSKHGRKPINYYLIGHFHRPMELPHANGEILVNGGWAGVDEFGLSQNFNAAPPQQRLYFVHRKFGRTANYYLSLEHAEPNSGHDTFALNGLCETLIERIAS